jgi:hypothetical protein
MGSTSVLVVGSEAEKLLAPYEYQEICGKDFAEHLRNKGLYYSWWHVEPLETHDTTEWRFAFNLKAGRKGEV